jgi:hypothetical protein
MIAYRERYLAESVRSCYENASNPQDLIFAVISEQALEELHADLSFIPANQIFYEKLDLSTYRGVLWSRCRTTELTDDYDFILYTCGHNRFAPAWDTKALESYNLACKLADKVLITYVGPDYTVESDESISFRSRENVTTNMYRARMASDYIPGHSFPELTEVPKTSELVEDRYLQFSWVFAPKEYVKEVPLDPDMNYHGEEIYVSVQSWCRGWRFFASPVVTYYHDTYKEYPGEQQSRMTTHRPWSDTNKDAFWKQSDDSMIKLNLLLSGKLSGKYGDISLEKVLEYCEFSGLDTKWCTYNPEYNNLGVPRHAEDFRKKIPN